MGTLRKRSTGWYAEVCVNRQRKGKTCRTKAAAEAWIKEMEAGLQAGPAHTVEDAFDRYRKAYTARKPSAHCEGQRLARLQAALGHDTLLTALTPDRLAEWRDGELERVSAASVARDWNLLNHILSVAVREWEWLPANPLQKLKRPAKGKPRRRVWTDEEVERFLYCTCWPGDTLQARVGDALLFALETGMRAGEICRIRPADVHERHVHIPKTKNGHARDVPLSSKAREILDRVGKDFGLRETQLDSLFRKARDRAGLDDLRFHDTRRTALTRLSKKLDALELARVSGHRDLRILLSTYYAPDVGDLADKLE